MRAASTPSIRRSPNSSRATTTLWWSAGTLSAASPGGNCARTRRWRRPPGCGRSADWRALLRQLVFQGDLAQALDLAGGSAARRDELAGDHAAARHDHALLQRLAVLAELVGEPRQRIERMAQHVARMAGANDSSVERDRAVELVDRELAPVLV